MTTQIELTRDQADHLQELANSRNITVSELIKSTVEQLAAPKYKKLDLETILRAKAAVGFAHGGPSDLSVEHDKYLSEVYEDRNVSVIPVHF